MRNAIPTANEEKLKNEHQIAKKAAKKAKEAYKAKLKEHKAKIKPLKEALKAAKKAEKEAKLAYKTSIGAITTVAEPETSAPRKRGRQPGYSPKAAKAAVAATPAQPVATPVAAPAAVASKGGNDNLTKVKGVGENIATMLKANGITSYADMASTSFERYKELLKANGMSKFRDPSQWAARAAELAKMPVKTKQGKKAEPAAKPVKVKVNIEEQKAANQKAAAKAGGDNLTKVKGVGENIAVMLKANGITTYSDMAATSFERYKELLKANGMSKFRDPSQWAARAAVLASMPPKQKGAPKAKAPAQPVAKAAPAPKAPKAAKAVVNHEEQKAANSQKAASAGGDNLTKVKGVGDNIAVMLKANGIVTYSDMAATSFERYKELLKANGMSKFRDPSQWAARAAELAKSSTEAGEAPKKRGRQPGFSPKAAKAPVAKVAAATEPAEAPKKRGRQPGYSPKAAKAAAAAPVAKVVVAPAPPAPAQAAPKAPAKPKAPPAKPDDLTQVKGVGQRVAEALNKEGIYTYKDMAEVSVDRYKEILKDNNMSKFRDPADWARLAGELAGKR